MPRALIQIVPRRARSPEGVGDYARRLAEQFAAAHGLETHFIACTPLPPEARAADRWETTTLERRAAEALAEALTAARRRFPAAPVLLHHSGYGYQTRGAPMWLTRGLAAWRGRDRGGRLVTVFHELDATGPIWRSSFWMQPLQKHVARRLLELSDAAATVTTPYLAKLRNWQGAQSARPMLHIPVFSNVGEPAAVTPASTRPARLAVFGRGYTAAAVYGEDRATIEAFIAAAGIEEVVDIGGRAVPPPGRLGGAALRALGEADESIVHDALLEARYGVIAYHPGYLEKSGIFAAYCAHGVIPLCLGDQPFGASGLADGVQCLRLPLTGPLPDPERIQAAARDWYAPHDLAATARGLAALLDPTTG